MGSLERLEAVGNGPFRFRHRGQTYTIPGPVELRPGQVIAVLESGHIPGTPPMPAWKRRRLFDAWSEHHDLPEPSSIRRLLFLVDRYHDAIEVDLQAYAGADLQALWKARRWRKLLNLIDHLPQNSWYHEAVSNDPEHVERITEAISRGEASAPSQEDTGPPLHTWSPELSALTDVTDRLIRIEHTLVAIDASNKKGAKRPQMPKMSPRPKTAMQTASRAAEHARRRKKHEDLVARMLPHKAKPKP